MRPQPNWSLYLVADPRMCGGRPVENVVEQAVRGGAAVVQLRIKDCTTREYVSQARRLHDLLTPLGVPLIINDRVDVALAVHAEGVHVGQADMPPDIARRLMGPDAVIGLSTSTLEQVRHAENLDVDYLGIGPVFPTTTKDTTAPHWGPDGLRDLRPQTRRPIVAIGGINPSNAASVIAAGADALAVLSAICSAPDPRQTARQLRAIIANARPSR